MRTFTSDDGTALAFHLLGDGAAPPVVVLPGGPCRGVEYLTDLAGLGAVRTLAVLHPRGTPTTGGLSRGWWRDADDVVALADHLGLDGVDVVAHSAGTRLALSCLARYPDRVRSLALVTPSAAWLTGTADDGPVVAARRGDALVDAAVAALLDGHPQDQAAYEDVQQVWAPAGYARWTDVEQQHSTLGDTSLAAARAWFRDVPDDAAERVRAAATAPPTLVVGGAQDILSGVRPVEEYARALEARLVLLEECGHYPWVEQPAAFRRALDPWFATA